MCLGSVLVPALLKVTALRFVQPLAAAGHVSDRFVNEGLGQALGGPVKTLHVLLARLALRNPTPVLAAIQMKSGSSIVDHTDRGSNEGR